MRSEFSDTLTQSQPRGEDSAHHRRALEVAAKIFPWLLPWTWFLTQTRNRTWTWIQTWIQTQTQTWNRTRTRTQTPSLTS